MRCRTSLVASVSLFFGVSACTGTSSRPETAEVTDSAGIQIVLSHGPVWVPGEGWKVSNVPIVQIGEREGDEAYQFITLWDAIRTPDGRYVAADDAAKEVKVFDSTGRHLQTIGGDGEGPGEFRAVWLVGVYRGDSIYAFDYGLMRTSIFAPDGTFGRAVRNPIPGNYWMTGVFADGSFLLQNPGEGRPQGPPGLKWDTAAVVVVSPDGDRVDTLGYFPNRQILLESNGLQAMYHFQDAAIGNAGAGEFFFGTSDHDEVRFYNREGELERIIRRGREAEPVTEETKEEYKAGFLSYMAKEQGVEAASRAAPMLDAAVYAEEVPFFGDVLLDSEGFLWVQDYSTPFFLNPNWSVFQPSGQWLGEVRMPSDLRVTDIGKDYVLGVRMDEDGVQYLQAFGLNRGGD